MNQSGNNLDKAIATTLSTLGESRMIRDNAPITDELKKAVAQALDAYKEKEEKSLDFIGDALDISTATLSQIINGHHENISDRMFRKIDKWLEIQYEKLKPDGIAETRIVREIMAAVKAIQCCGGIALVTGDAGIGKSIALEYAMKKTPAAIKITVTAGGLTARAILQSIAIELKMGITGASGAATKSLERMVVDKLEDTGRLIIIDEVHLLAGREFDKPIQMIRAISDATSCPIMLAGNCLFSDYIESHMDPRDPLGQFNSRITYRVPLDAIVNDCINGGGGGPFNAADIQNVVNTLGLRIKPTKDAIRAATAMANTPTLGHLRFVCKLFQVASLFAEATEAGTITTELLNDVIRKQRGDDYLKIIHQKAHAVESQKRLAAVG
jgi:DNA transposition AAA+ family ATPase